MSAEDTAPSTPEVPTHEAPEPTAPPSGGPPGTVQLTTEEHNRLQADARTARRRADKLEQDAKAREDREAQEAAKAAGDFDTALRIEREKGERLEREATERDVRDAVRDHIIGLGYSGSRVTALQKLVSTTEIGEAHDADTIAAVVATTISQYPDLFIVKDDAPEGGSAPRVRRTPGPSTPPDDASRAASDPDYISPQEYLDTPHAVRHSPEFRARVDKSRPHWPTSVSATAFTVGQ
jgi:hypothetical protein